MNLPKMRDSRKNNLMRSVVEFGKALAKEDIDNAADYLRQHGVPLHVAVRVLANNHTKMEWSKCKPLN